MCFLGKLSGFKGLSQTYFPVKHGLSFHIWLAETSLIKFFGGFLPVSKTFPRFPALRVKNCFFQFKSFHQKKQICTPQAGNPGNNLLSMYQVSSKIFISVQRANMLLSIWWVGRSSLDRLKIVHRKLFLPSINVTVCFFV